MFWREFSAEIMGNMIHLTCYGGVNDIGGNKFLVDSDNESVFLDFGLSFGEEAYFFEEFLQPRSVSKIQDLLKLGLLPSINGIYREDALRPIDFQKYDFRGKSLWEVNLESFDDASQHGSWHPRGLFISHAHLDHCGYVPYLGNIPLFCSETTHRLMDALCDVGNLPGLDDQLTVMKKRAFGKLRGGYFPGELQIDYVKEAENRENHILSHKKAQPINDAMEITGFNVDHSIPGSMACIVESKGSQILYTGDLRFHGLSGYNLKDELSGLKPDAMICEGTRIEEQEPDDEKKVESELTELFSKSSGLAIISFAWKDIERYETVRNAAIKSERTPVFDPRLAYLLARLGGSVYKNGAKAFLERCNCMLYSPGDYVMSKHKIGEMPLANWCSKPGKRVVDVTHLKSGISACEINQSPHSYVLQLDFFRFKNILDLELPKGSTYVRAHCEPLNPRMDLSDERMIRWLKHFGINVENDNKPYHIHASGHACGKEIQEMINEIQPRVLVPVHTTRPDLFSNPAGAIMKPEKGVKMKLCTA